MVIYGISLCKDPLKLDEKISEYTQDLEVELKDTLEKKIEVDFTLIRTTGRGEIYQGIISYEKI